ncbi:hypothetical protein [Stenomitos frigidus]|uniref:Uncharacterized protein n=1 Tax=Stenomitos frigidus ULC18 TaxID=2107698 RepID=A0A2T1E9L6_9CYAN|nr:hypothetical protein [Stenomitos frigidus]PSB29442.1 hypothetical protein C7B82_11525 [Stenomitos frigidus ULC18]
MPETKRYAIDPDSLKGCRIRVSFHFKELQRETNPIVRANIAQYLAEATATLALLEAEEARKIAL